MSDDWQVVDIAIDMLKRGQHLNADHPLVVIEAGFERLRERVTQLERKNAEMLERGTEWLQAIQRSIEQTERAEAEVRRLRSES